MYLLFETILVKVILKLRSMNWVILGKSKKGELLIACHYQRPKQLSNKNNLNRPIISKGEINYYVE